MSSRFSLPDWMPSVHMILTAGAGAVVIIGAVIAITTWVLGADGDRDGRATGAMESPTAIATDAPTEVSPPPTVTVTPGWYPAQIGVFQPSIRSVKDELSKLQYSSPPSSASTLVSAAKDYLGNSDYQAAYDALSEAIEVDEGNAEAYFWLGFIFPALGGPPEISMLWLDSAIEKDTSSEQIMAMYAYRQRGMFSVQSGEYDAAVADFTECVGLGSDREEVIPTFFQVVYTNRGIIYEQLGRQNEALRDYERTLELAQLEPVPPLVDKARERVEAIKQ